MSVYVLRHGETSWNKDYFIQGRVDIPLNETGIRQAEEAGKALKDIHIDLCFCSPLKRAVQTAEIALRGKEVPLRIDNRIIEMAYGDFEGVSRNDESFLVQYKKFASRYPGGESYLDVAQRVFNFLDEIKANHRNENVLLVCHGGIGRAIRAYFLDELENDDFLNGIFENAKVLCFEFKDRNIPLIQGERNHN